MPRIISKPKFDKDKCLKCKYHSQISGAYTVRAKNIKVPVCCNYAKLNFMTCLQPGPNNTVIDIRGNDYNNCKLFKEGVAQDEN